MKPNSTSPLSEWHPGVGAIVGLNFSGDRRNLARHRGQAGSHGVRAGAGQVRSDRHGARQIVARVDRRAAVEFSLGELRLPGEKHTDRRKR